MSTRAPPTPPGSPGGSFTDMNDDQNARRRRQLLEDLKTLSSLGLSKELELPQLVCVGSQSAGKSSLIESLCRITLPRASGTCTRCPIECRAKYADQEWHGSVLLRILPEDSEQGDAREIPFGDVMTDPVDMEMRIAQAQLAVLNPATDSETFLNVDPTRYKTPGGSGFTNNSVVVDLVGRGLADLNFVDLPGLIVSVSEGGETSHIELVADMVRRYISKRSTIILLVISCHADYENQGAGLLARECDPRGERTVGVLTKPDRIESLEEAEPWLAMVAGRSNRLANGWYCVKQPDSRQRKRNLTWEDARNLEAEFFQTTEPWASLGGQGQVRLGSGHLAFQLGNVLSVALEKRLPEIRLEIDRLLGRTNQELGQLPRPPDKKPSEFMLDLLERFYEEAKEKLVRGDPNDTEGVIQTIREYSSNFRYVIQEAAPVFLPNNEMELDVDTKPEFIPADERWLTKSEVGNGFTLKHAGERAGGGILRETSDFCSFAPTQWYMSRVVDVWERNAINLLEMSAEKFDYELRLLVDRHFSVYACGGLFELMSEVTQKLLRDCKAHAEEQIRFLSEQEKYPRTFHEQHYQDRMMQFMQYYKTTLGADAAALTTMARTRALYEIAFRRYADVVPMTIDLHFVRTFGRKLNGYVSRDLDVNRDEEEMKALLKLADPILAHRDALTEKVERLRAARVKLSAHNSRM